MHLKHLTLEELEAGLKLIRESPSDDGVLRLIVRRPKIGEREILEAGALDLASGLVGDGWKTRNALPRPDKQLNIMNSRVIALIAQDESRWALAGDQLFVDLDLSMTNVPAGTQLKIGEAVIEVTDQPHTGCQKFAARFGVDAVNFVNSPLGRQLQLRGVNARVVEAGAVRRGDVVKKLRTP